MQEACQNFSGASTHFSVVPRGPVDGDAPLPKLCLELPAVWKRRAGEITDCSPWPTQTEHPRFLILLVCVSIICLFVPPEATLFCCLTKNSPARSLPQTLSAHPCGLCTAVPGERGDTHLQERQGISHWRFPVVEVLLFSWDLFFFYSLGFSREKQTGA